jgi:hypothetical protein
MVQAKRPDLKGAEPAVGKQRIDTLDHEAFNNVV